MLLLAIVFVVMPVYVFESLVMPELQSLQHTYSHLDETANAIASER
jgi:hypothetical protein